MESDDDVPLILTWDEASSGLLSEEAERGGSKSFRSLSATGELCSVFMAL